MLYIRRHRKWKKEVEEEEVEFSSNRNSAKHRNIMAKYYCCWAHHFLYNARFICKIRCRLLGARMCVFPEKEEKQHETGYNELNTATPQKWLKQQLLLRFSECICINEKLWIVAPERGNAFFMTPNVLQIRITIEMRLYVQCHSKNKPTLTAEFKKNPTMEICAEIE